ncbi:hypothetical protein CIC12_05065, partial [Burkholderia sp. SG-MS1]|uniref:hypothetical protein n=1 Tax=Paraburkholderia sp. SG-MS1 TaxID=2023741 RepID=UPI0014481D39
GSTFAATAALGTAKAGDKPAAKPDTLALPADVVAGADKANAKARTDYTAASTPTEKAAMAAVAPGAIPSG